MSLIEGPGYIGDFAAGVVVRFKTSTHDASAAPVGVTGGLAATIYKDASFVQSSSGLSIIENFDGLASLQHWDIDTSANAGFFTAGSDFVVVVTGGAIGVALGATVVASFSLANRKTPTPEIGDGDKPVDHNTGGADALRYTIASQPADNVVIKAYLKSEYDAGSRIIRGTAHTGPDGRWLAPLMLNSGAYTLVAWIPGVSDPVLTLVTVS